MSVTLIQARFGSESAPGSLSQSVLHNSIANPDCDTHTELASCLPFIRQLTSARPVIGYKPGGLDFPSNDRKLKWGLAAFSG
jgi:hypothetical protein